MGLGLLFPRLLGLGQLVTALLVLSILMCPPEPSGRQSGDLGEKWRQFGLRNILFSVLATGPKVRGFDPDRG
jgi:hypothetical protein